MNLGGKRSCPFNFTQERSVLAWSVPIVPTVQKAQTYRNFCTLRGPGCFCSIGLHSIRDVELSQDNYSFLQLHLKWRSVGAAGVGFVHLNSTVMAWDVSRRFKVTPCYVHLYITSSSPGLRWICFQRAGGHHVSAWLCNWLAKSSAVFQADSQLNVFIQFPQDSEGSWI